MLSGQPTTTVTGRIEDIINYFEVEAYPNGVGGRLFVQPKTLYGNLFYPVVVDGVYIGSYKLSDAEINKIELIFDPFINKHTVSVLCPSRWPRLPQTTNYSFQQDIFNNDKGQYINIKFKPELELTVPNDNQFSNWNVKGLTRYLNCYSVDGFPTQLEADLELVTTNVHTINIYVGELLIATGSRLNDGEVILNQINNSNVYGSVNLVYNSDITIATLRGRFPSKYYIYVDGILNKTIADNNSKEYNIKLGPLTSTQHNVQIASESDTGVLSPLSNALSVTVPSVAEPCRNLAYASGSALDTVISWDASNTAFYRVRASQIGQPVSLDAYTDVSGIGHIVLNLEPVSGYPGTRTVLLSSLINNVEDGYNNQLQLEYDDSGNYVWPRPNIPNFNLNSIVSGNQINIDWTYNTADEKGSANKVNLYLIPINEYSNPNFNNPTSTMDIINEGSLRSGVISGINISSGFYYFNVKACSISGSLSSNDNLIGPVWISNVPPNTPNIEVSLG